MPSHALSDTTEDNQPLKSADDQLQLKSDKEAKAVFLPEERSPRLSWQQKLAKSLKIRNEYVRIFLAELLGTFVLVALGCGALAQETVGKRYGDGNIVTVIFGWGLAVAMGVYMCGGASGGHINPAFTTAMTVMGRLPVIKMPIYWAGQYVGAMLGAFAVFVIYIDGLNHVNPNGYVSKGYDLRNPNATDGIFGTFPKNHVSVEQGFADQIFGTMLLVLLAMAITDERNMGVPKGMIPIVLGFGVVGILTGYATNCGAALNPARDFSPRVVSTIVGWKGGPFAAKSWWWVPILGPHLGAICGALLYNICVGLHWPEPVERYT